MKLLGSIVNPRHKHMAVAFWLSLWAGLLMLAGQTQATDQPANSPPVRQHAEQSFQQLQQHEQPGSPSGGQGELRDGAAPPPLSGNQSQEGSGKYASDQFLIGKGQGDLSKGKIVCQRVSEMAARTDLAKQIRVLVKEHATDRVRERSGRDSEQDIEVIREEIVQEYLQGVKIMDRQIDEAAGTCSSMAVMPKSQIAPKPAPDTPEPTPTVIR
ncbi:MAG: hypothetical protein E6K69_00595 [Nitrospirae bacterium]|nr:MAG: hypothetical protein E6K69_00595 [Nitrospirota bacterium]